MTSPEPADDRLHALVERLVARGLTVATAESLTGGLLGALITAVPGASATFRGGLIVYATDLKASLAHVDPALAGRRRTGSARRGRAAGGRGPSGLRGDVSGSG